MEAADLVAALVSPTASEDERLEALASLSDFAADSYGQEAANLAKTLRDSGAITMLVQSAESPALDAQ